MSATSVGQIGLDLVVNQKQFNKQMTGIQSLAKKAGGMLASAFAVKKLVDFGKQCVELGSDLQEVQNVVDVTFPNMSKKVDKFSKSAAASFGLSETMAKKFTGTFGSMAKAFGFSEEQAYEMGTALTGLAGDVASFYNLTQDEAYTKLKSVFTGETESLKDLGVVMTQTALDSYALANGFGKTTKSMSEAEKVALRYAFVQDQLSAASGDFTRTSDGWANQVRVLNLQFDSLKATLGQGLINLFTPVLKVVNTLIGKMSVLAERFKAFTELITGKKTNDTQLSAATTSADALSESVSGVGEAAKKSAKEMKALAGFDELNNLSSSTTESPDDLTGAITNNNTSGSMVVPNSVNDSLDEMQKKLDKLANWTGIDKLVENIQKGVNKIDFDGIKQKSESIFKNLVPIGKTAFDGLGKIIRSKMNFIGTKIGHAVSLVGKGMEIAVGSFDKFLSSESGNISNWIAEISGKIATGFDNLSFSADNIFGSLWNAIDTNQDKIETAGADILTTFSDVGMSLGSIFSDMFTDLSDQILKFTTEEKPLFDEFFNGIIDSGLIFSDTINNIVGEIFGTLDKWWEEGGKKIWNEVVEMFTDVIGWVMKLWTNIIKPVVDEMSKELGTLWENHLKPLWNNVLGFITSVWDVVVLLWDKVLKPLIDWIMEYIGPVIADVCRVVMRVVGTLIGWISDVLGGIIKSLKGLLDFIVGVFTGDWEKAWNGIKDFFGGIWDAIWGSIKATINLIIDGINLLWAGLYGSLRNVINGVGGIVEKLGNAVGKDWGFSIPKKAPLIPKLAGGGYVKANTPQLAIIGDNLHQGEIVSPEDKLEEMALKAAQMAGGRTDDVAIYQIIQLLKNQNELLAAILEKTGISDKDLFNSVRKSAESYKNRTGNPAFSY